ncbi:MAG: flagellar hook-associated protein FlgL [Candidatus Zixiibacteriota bacterium]
MALRVTNEMISGRVVFNLQRSIRRYLNLQTNMSTGRRINLPSDDPLGAVRDLNYRAELARIEQYQKNISQGQNWQATYESALNEAKDLVSTAKEIAIAMANGHYDDIARQSSANEVQLLFDQLIQLSGTELEGRQVFSGFRTKTEPLALYANGVAYRGDTGKFEFEIEPGSRTIVNLDGAELFLRQFGPLGEDADLNVGVTSSTLLADLNGGAGISQVPGTFTITDRNLNITSTIDLSGATTLGDALAAINAQLAADGITNLTATLGAEGNNILLDSTPNGLISTSTQLSKLNSGNGVDLNPGNIRVSNGAGVDVIVDLSGSLTVDDIITKFNTQLAANGVANVTMSINGTQTGLAITDTNGVPLNLTISETSDQEQTAAMLGIAGQVGAAMTGAALNPAVFFSVADTTGTTAADLTIQGEFSADFSGGDLNPRLTSDALLTSFRNGSGVDRSSFVMWQGGSNATIDLSSPSLVTVQDLIDAINASGLTVTASINAAGTGIQINNDDPNKSFTIEDVGAGRAAKDMGLFGSSDTMGTMLVLLNALKRDDQEGTGMLLGNLDNSIQHVLNQRAIVGARAQKLEATDNRLSDMFEGFTKLLSEVEDADLTTLVTDLATYENNYKAALNASALIVQPSLLDFLR